MFLSITDHFDKTRRRVEVRRGVGELRACDGWVWLFSGVRMCAALGAMYSAGTVWALSLLISASTTTTIFTVGSSPQLFFCFSHLGRGFISCLRVIEKDLERRGKPDRNFKL